MSALRERAWSIDGQRVDTIFAVVMIVELQLESWLNRGIPGSHRLVTAVACVLLAAPIAIRRYRPGSALVFSCTVAAIQTLLGGELISSLTGELVVLLAVAYAAGAWATPRHSVIAVALGLGLLWASVFLPGDGPTPTGFGAAATNLFWVSAMIIPGWFVGRLARLRSRRADAFRLLAAQLNVEREQLESAAIGEERLRIGSELQDVIAHSVSAMVIQAGGARRTLRTDPDRARDSMLNIENAGREALADLRRLLGMLRKDEDPRALAPQPGLNQLAALIESMHHAGLDCELRIDGEPIDRTPGVDLVGYRSVEAALQTAAQHHTQRTVITLRYRPNELQVDIRGRGSIPDLNEQLHAIAQRVALYDGTLCVPPTGTGEFALDVRLPVAQATPA
jgi:signal transduction histidine kinase